MTDMITRTKKGKGWQYKRGDKTVDKATAMRVASLAIPPAWTDVEIAINAKSKVQATGYDNKGRKQYIYSKAHSEKQDAAKFDRITDFASNLPRLRKRIEKDIKRRRFDKKKVLAAALSLMDEEYFRVGNASYAKQNKSFGLTTLRSKHVTIEKSKIVFDFIGKSGQEHHKVVRDGTLVRLVATLDDMPGYELFRYYDKKGTLHNLDSSDINEYIKSTMGEEYSAKDFRTWGGTLLAAITLAEELRPATKTARKKAMTDCAKKVAKKLGNTPTIAKKSYIDPRVFETFDTSDGIDEVYKAVKDMKPRKYLSDDERWVLELLRR